MPILIWCLQQMVTVMTRRVDPIIQTICSTAIQTHILKDSGHTFHHNSIAICQLNTVHECISDFGLFLGPVRCVCVCVCVCVCMHACGVCVCVCMHVCRVCVAFCVLRSTNVTMTF